MSDPTFLDPVELETALAGFAVALAKSHANPVAWKQQLEEGTGIPESARYLGRHALLTERLMGQGASHTAVLLVELGFQTLAHLQKAAGEGARHRGFFQGMKQAVQIFTRAVNTFRAVPDWRKALEETYFDLKALPDARKFFSLAVREDFEVILPKLHERQVVERCAGIKVFCSGQGVEVTNVLINPAVYVSKYRIKVAPDVKSDSDTKRQEAVFFAPSINGRIVQEYSRNNLRCYTFELGRNSSVTTKYLWDVCGIGNAFPQYGGGNGRAAAISFEPSGVTILGVNEPLVFESRPCLVTDLSDQEPEWQALDGSFRSYRESFIAGLASHETISQSINFLEKKIPDLPREQAMGARAVVAAVSKLLLRTPISAPATTFALENASVAVRDLLHHTSGGLGAQGPDVRAMQLTSAASYSLPPSHGKGGGGQGSGGGAGEGKHPNGRTGENHRYLDVLLVGEVCPSQRVILTGIIRLPQSSPTGQAQSKGFAVLGNSIVLFRIACIGFLLESAASVERQVPPDHDSEPATFIFQVQESAARWIEVSLFDSQSNQLLAQVTLNHFALQRIEKQQIIRGADSVDLTINVGNDLLITADSPRSCENLAGVEVGSIRGLRRGWQGDLDKRVEALYQNAPEDIERELKLLGAEVADSLPQDLCQLLGRGNVKTLLVRHTVDNSFPFELALLSGPEGQFFLGDRVAVGRWIRGIPSAPTWETKIVRRAALLKGAIGLASDELSTLQTTCCQTEGFGAPLAIREQVFRTRSFQLLHFFGHCRCQDEPDKPAELYLELEEGQLRLREIGTLEDERAFFDESPIVVLNACGTGAPCYTLLSEDSFPNRFLRHNASFFMGTQWPVEETVAHTFAEAFYQKVSSGKTVGTAMLESKQDVVAPESKLSDEQKAWARISLRSYMLFAHPDMKIAFGPFT